MHYHDEIELKRLISLTTLIIMNALSLPILCYSSVQKMKLASKGNRINLQARKKQQDKELNSNFFFWVKRGL